MISLPTHVRLTGLVAVVMLALGGWLTVMVKDLPAPARGYPHGLGSPVLAMELVSSVEEVSAIAGELGDPRRAVLETNTRADFAFITAYGALFVLVGLLWRRTASGGARLRAVVAIVMGLAAAALDVVENLGILRALSVRLAELDDAQLAAIHTPSYAKWALSFATIGVVSALFRREGASAGVRWIARLFLSSAIVGLAGLAQPRLFEPGLMLMSAGVLLLAVTALARPGALLPDAATSADR